MSFKYFKFQMKVLIFASFCFGAFGITAILFLRYPREITLPMGVIVAVMTLGTTVALYQLIVSYRHIKAYIYEKCYFVILDKKKTGNKRNIKATQNR